MTRMHKLYRHSVTTGKCEDCGLIDNHSNACHEAAPIRKIEDLYDQLDAANLEIAALRKALGGSEWAICGWCAGTGKDYGKDCPKCQGAGGQVLK